MALEGAEEVARGLWYSVIGQLFYFYSAHCTPLGTRINCFCLNGKVWTDVWGQIVRVVFPWNLIPMFSRWVSKISRRVSKLSRRVSKISRLSVKVLWCELKRPISLWGRFITHCIAQTLNLRTFFWMRRAMLLRSWTLKSNWNNTMKNIEHSV